MTICRDFIPYARTLSLTLALALPLTLTSPLLAPPALAQHVEPIASSYVSNVTMSTYMLPSLGLRLSYPRNWKVEEKPDKDTLVKTSGTLQDTSYGNVSVSATAQNNVSLPTFCKMIEEAFLSKQPGYQRLSEHNISFGRDHKLVGFDRLITMDMGGTKFKQRWVTFPQGSDFVSVNFTSPADQYDKMAPLYNNILLRLSPIPNSGGTANNTGGRQSAQTSANPSNHAANGGAGDGTLDYTSVKANGAPIEISYPKAWKLESSLQNDQCLKIQSQQGDGGGAEIALYSNDMPPNVSLDYMIGKMAEKIYEGKKDYHLINRQSASFGSGSSLDGVEQEVSFQHDGVPFKQRMVSFVNKDKFYILFLTSTKTKDSEDRLIFSRVKSSIAVKD